MEIVINCFLMFSLCLTSLLPRSKSFPISHHIGQPNDISLSPITNERCYFLTSSTWYNLFLCLNGCASGLCSKVLVYGDRIDVTVIVKEVVVNFAWNGSELGFHCALKVLQRKHSTKLYPVLRARDLVYSVGIGHIVWPHGVLV